MDVLLGRQKGQYVEDLLGFALGKHSLKNDDRGFLQEIVYGVVRWELTLDWLIAQKTGGRLQKDLVQNLLRLALYQMFWLERVPSYAAVNETVEICKSRGLVPQAKFVNAVLRGFGREMEATRQKLEDLKKSRPAIGFSHPEWLSKRWEKSWGAENAPRLMEWNNSPPPVFVRANALRGSVEELLSMWEQEQVIVDEFSADWVPKKLIFRFKSHPPISNLRSFHEGRFYIQDPSTLLAPTMLDLFEGASVFDVCSAPGGKNYHGGSGGYQSGS